MIGDQNPYGCYCNHGCNCKPFTQTYISDESIHLVFEKFNEEIKKSIEQIVNEAMQEFKKNLDIELKAINDKLNRKYEYENSFVVLPKHANYHSPMIFGGEFFAQLDLCAATCVNRFLHDSDCETAVTHKAEVNFLAPCYVGDIIFMKARVASTGKKSIVIDVTAERERRQSAERDLVATVKFVFVSIEHTKDVASMPEKLPYKEHGLSI